MEEDFKEIKSLLDEALSEYKSSLSDKCGIKKQDFRNESEKKLKYVIRILEGWL